MPNETCEPKGAHPILGGNISIRAQLLDLHLLFTHQLIDVHYILISFFPFFSVWLHTTIRLALRNVGCVRIFRLQLRLHTLHKPYS